MCKSLCESLSLPLTTLIVLILSLCVSAYLHLSQRCCCCCRTPLKPLAWLSSPPPALRSSKARLIYLSDVQVTVVTKETTHVTCDSCLYQTTTTALDTPTSEPEWELLTARYSFPPAGPAVTLMPIVHWGQDSDNPDNLVPSGKQNIYHSTDGINGQYLPRRSLIFCLSIDQTQTLHINLVGSTFHFPLMPSSSTNAATSVTPTRRLPASPLSTSIQPLPMLKHKPGGDHPLVLYSSPIQEVAGGKKTAFSAPATSIFSLTHVNW